MSRNDQHGSGCVCWRCDSDRQQSRISSAQAAHYQEYVTGHGTNCSCWNCHSQREEQIYRSMRGEYDQK